MPLLSNLLLIPFDELKQIFLYDLYYMIPVQLYNINQIFAYKDSQNNLLLVSKIMFQRLSFSKQPKKQRSKSQSVTNRNEAQMLKTVLTNEAQMLKTVLTKPKKKKPVMLNMLLNGQSIQQIITDRNQTNSLFATPKNDISIREYIYQKYLTDHNEDCLTPQADSIQTNSLCTNPKNNISIHKYIYRKYLTENSEEHLTPQAENVIRLRQMFNQRLISRNSVSIKADNEQKWPKISVRKVTTGVTNPDLNSLTYIRRSKKYDNLSNPFRERYFRIVKQRKLQLDFDREDLIVQKSETIDPWETNY